VRGPTLTVMFSPYRTILARPGALAFSSAGLLARLPLSMVGLGIVLLVSASTGSYGLAGSVSAAYLVANAVFAVPQGRLLDRLGQGRVLAVAVWIFAVSLGVMTASVQGDWPGAVTYLSAALAGATLPTVGASVRARWSFVLQKPAQVQTAYALESVLDEVVFITGPILVTVLATAWAPVAGLAAAIVAALVGTLALAAQRGTAPPAGRHESRSGDLPRMPWRPMGTIALVCVALGALFGAAEVATVAFSEELGTKAYAGPLLALWAAGSLIAGIVTGAIRWRRGPGVRLRFGAAGMALAMAPMPFVGSLGVMALALFVGGFAIAPTLIATSSLTEQTVPRVRLVEGMAIVHTGIAGGVAPGAALAGILIDAHGASAAYLVPAVAGLVAAIAAQGTPR
jgi:MFS family permease